MKLLDLRENPTYYLTLEEFKKVPHIKTLCILKGQPFDCQQNDDCWPEAAGLTKIVHFTPKDQPSVSYFSQSC